jgi:UDP-N-acetylmuramoyl-L-alanyl-D-glutamate--2,6-diaminopimelate ligase
LTKNCNNKLLITIKTLADILTAITPVQVQGNATVAIGQIIFDSRKVTAGDVFVALKGTQLDGHAFIATAIERGAAAIVCETLPAAMPDNCCFVQVANSAEALGKLASAYYGFPSQKLKLTGITGTNGKTTTVTLLHQLFTKLGYKAGLISTIRNLIGETEIPATHTTPDAVSLNALLAQMVAEGCTHAFMEVSSHALVQYRTAGLTFAGAIFSNITHDHLDYHGTFDAYIRAKKMFFDGLGKNAFALINKDDKRSAVMVQNTAAKVHTFALHSPADFKGKVLANTVRGLQMEIDGKEVWFRLIGDFNAYNLLGIYGAAVLLGENPEQVLTILSRLDSAQGRFDRIVAANGTTAIIDYAHTPDALKNVLQTIRSLRGQGKESIITVVGCGGNRDAAKRPVMAQIACQFSDRVLLTSDNPRFEKPEAILADMEKGVPADAANRVQVITDRKQAIVTAIAEAKAGDIILIAGKGHEDYQEIEGVKYPFDDKKIAAEYLSNLN